MARIPQTDDKSTLGTWRDRLLARARKEAAAPLSLKSGDNLAVAPMVSRMAFAAALTGENALRQAAFAQMRQLLALPSWASSRHQGMCDLHVADTAVAMALAYHLLRDEMTPQERKRVLKELNRLAIDPYLSDARRRRVSLVNVNNWNGVTNGGLLAVALLLEPEGNRRVEPLARRFLAAYLNHFADDGGWDEAADYLWYGLRNPALAAYLAEKRGRPLEFPEKIFRAPSWQEKFTSPAGRTPAFGDATWNAKPSSAAGYLALASHDPAALRAFERRGESTDPVDLLYLASLGELKPEPTPPSPPRYVSPIGWAVARSGDAWLVVRGGVTRSNHSHLDLGSFVLEVGGDILLTDPGVPHPYPYAEGYFDAVKRWQHPAIRSSSHSTVLIGGVQQTLTASFDIHLEGDALVGEMTQGYTQALKLWRRTWRLGPDSLLIRDHLELTGALPVSWIFVAPQAWDETLRTREWRSGSLVLQLEEAPTPQSVQRTPPVLDRAYPVEITLPASEAFDVKWKFRWSVH